MRLQSLSRCWLLALAAGILLASRSADACSVPVFRYALERWPADPYELVVFHRGELSPADQKLVEQLQKAPLDEKKPANLQVVTVDLDGEPKEAYLELFEEQKSAKLPWTVLRYPYLFGRTATVWAGSLDQKNVESIVDSPLRQKIAKLLGEGETAVWVILESGDEEKDAAAAKTLEENLAQLEKDLELPEIEQFDLSYLSEGAATSEKLKVSFSTVRLQRDDPAEKHFISMLLGSEEDLKPEEGEKVETMAFPIFGRGRALYAYVGAGINADTIADACIFLTGPCSCQVKAQNPGVDLLLAVNWDALIASETIQEQPLPDLSGFERFLEVTDDPASSEAGAEDTEVKETASDPAESQPELSPEDADVLASLSDVNGPAEDEVSTAGSVAEPASDPPAAEETPAEPSPPESAGETTESRPSAEVAEIPPPEASGAVDRTTERPVEASGDDSSSGSLLRTTLLVLAGGLFVIVLLSLLVMRKSG